MTSKLIVNSLAADTGVSTITFADQAKMGNSLFHSTGFTIGDSFLHSTGLNLTNVNATGVITATKFVGEVSVGSSITFEDNEKAYFGTSTDFSIYHNGSASYLDETGTGGLIVKTDTAFQVFNSAGSQPAFTVTPGGSVELYHNTTKVLETKSYGIDIPDSITHSGDTNTKIRFPAADQISFETGGTNRLKLHYYASNHHVELDSSTHLSLADNGSNGRFIYMGDANASSTGYMHLQPGSGSQGFGGGIRLYSHANSTNAGGVYIGKSLNSSGAIIFGNGGMTPSTEYARIASDGVITGRGELRLTQGTSVVNNGDEIGSLMYLYPSNDNKNAKIAALQNGGSSGADLAFYTRTQGDASNTDGGTEKLRITSSGKAGINDTTPDATLSVGGATAFIDVGVAGGNRGKIGYSSNDLYLGTSSSSGEFIFKNNINSDDNPASSGTERLRISSTGNVTANTGNIIIGTAEKGIDFSAQTAASSGTVVSEVMNHFSTGTIGITLKAGSNTVPLYNNTARYTRIGNICFISIWIRVNGSTVGSSYSSTDYLKLTGLPFAGSGNNSGRTRMRFNGYSFTGVSNRTWGWLVVSDGATTTEHELHWGEPSFNTIIAPNGTHIHNSSAEIYINGHYFV